MKSSAWRIWVVVFLFSIPLSAQQAPQTAADAIAGGKAKLAKGDAAGAKTLFDKAVQLDAGDASAWAYLATASGRLGDLDGSLADIDKAISIKPGDVDYYRFRAEVHAAKSDFEAAAKDYKHYLDVVTNDTDVVFALATAYGMTKDFDHALPLADEYITFQPEAARGYILRSKLRAYSGDMEGAEADADALIQQSPKDATNYMRRSNLKCAVGDITGAMADANHAVELAPDAPFAYDNRGVCQLIAGKFQASLADFRKELELAKNGAEMQRSELFISLIAARITGQDTTLQKHADPKPEEKDFFSNTLRYLTGKLPEKDYVPAAVPGNVIGRNSARATAWYIIGMRNIAIGGKSAAGDAFRKCIIASDGDLTDFAMLAKAEIDRLAKDASEEPGDEASPQATPAKNPAPPPVKKADAVATPPPAAQPAATPPSESGADERAYDGDERKFYHQAINYCFAGKYDAALAAADKLILLVNSPVAYWDRITCLFSAGRWAQAADELRKFRKMPSITARQKSTSALYLYIARRMAGGQDADNASRDLLIAAKSGEFVGEDLDAANFLLGRSDDQYIPKPEPPKLDSEIDSWLEAWFYVGMNYAIDNDRVNAIKAFKICGNTALAESTLGAMLEGESKRLDPTGEYIEADPPQAKPAATKGK